MSARSVGHSVMYYVRRYGPAEAFGTVTALAAGWLAMHATGSIAASAIAATIGESIGYYAIPLTQDTKRWWRKHEGMARKRRIYTTIKHVARGSVIEFGPAEIVDSLTRPTLIVTIAAVTTMSHLITLFVAKISADIMFYTLAVIGHRLARRVEAKALRPESTEPVQASI